MTITSIVIRRALRWAAPSAWLVVSSTIRTTSSTLRSVSAGPMGVSPCAGAALRNMPGVFRRPRRYIKGELRHQTRRFRLVKGGPLSQRPGQGPVGGDEVVAEDLDADVVGARLEVCPQPLGDRP